MAFGDHRSEITYPQAILGVGFHRVMEAGISGGLGPPPVAESARALFDMTVRTEYETSRPLLKAKFSTPQHFPFYYRTREQAAVAVASLAAHHSRVGGLGRPHWRAERSLTSKDGQISGRLDALDEQHGEVIDYKTRRLGSIEPTPDERRQLQLYVFLARDNGVDSRRARLVRASGSSYVVDVSAQDAEEAADAARRALGDFNSKVTAGATFETLATPGPDVCGYCPCLAICVPFWRSASPDWQTTVGAQLQGVVLDVADSTGDLRGLISLSVRVTGGTLESDRDWVVEQIPRNWIEAGGEAAPIVDETVRVTDARVIQRNVVRVDRIATAIWNVSKGAALQVAFP